MVQEICTTVCSIMALDHHSPSRPRGPKGRASLDKTTNSPRQCGRARVTVYPRCREAVVSIVQTPRLQIDRSRKGEHGENRERCHQVAVRRARRELRRYCVNHRLFFMWTLHLRERWALGRASAASRSRTVRRQGRDCSGRTAIPVRIRRRASQVGCVARAHGGSVFL